jgi:hypothetical protein
LWTCILGKNNRIQKKWSTNCLEAAVKISEKISNELCNRMATKKRRKSTPKADDDVFYLFLQKQKIGAKLHIYL